MVNEKDETGQLGAVLLLLCSVVCMFRSSSGAIPDLDCFFSSLTRSKDMPVLGAVRPTKSDSHFKSEENTQKLDIRKKLEGKIMVKISKQNSCSPANASVFFSFIRMLIKQDNFGRLFHH